MTLVKGMIYHACKLLLVYCIMVPVQHPHASKQGQGHDASMLLHSMLNYNLTRIRLVGNNLVWLEVV